MIFVTIVFYILLGLYFMFGAMFQYHEIVIGVMALIIGGEQLIRALRS